MAPFPSKLLPFSLLPHPPFPFPSPLLLLLVLPSLPSIPSCREAAHRGSGGGLYAPPVGSGAKPQPTLILVYCERDKTHLTAIIIWIFVYWKFHTYYLSHSHLSLSKCKSGDVTSCQNIGSRGGSSPKILGLLPHQPIHNWVHFLRSPKPEKYELHIGVYLKFIISTVANTIMGWALRPI